MKVIRVSGPLVVVNAKLKLYEIVRVGEEKLFGEVIKISGDKSFIQVYEDTTGLKVGEPVERTNQMLSVELGPGLLANIFDGIGRPLERIYEKLNSPFIKRGVVVNTLDREKKWEFIPKAEEGKEVKPGEVLGIVKETPTVEHKILVPPNVQGKLEEIKEGKFRVDEPIAVIDGKEIPMMQIWPVRRPRPFKEKLEFNYPFVTGMRVLDIMFPIAKGGSAAVPGPFGSGKTVTNQQIAKWSDANVVIYIGCGERGNEMTEVLEEFPKLEDPKTGQKLIYRTILIANTSNMPVAAREASIYIGATIGEYFRDQGYSVVLNADSTSRWAEAMREIAGRLGELPSEEGYPAYLARKIAEFYERSGRVKTLSGEEGALTIIGAVSPPGGDFSEPVTQNTLRFVGAFWALDAKLAYRRHYPAINYLISYTKHWEYVKEFFVEKFGEDIPKIREEFFRILKKEADLQDIVSVVGPDALADKDRLILHIGRVIREGFLQQDAFDPIDTYSPLEKSIKLMRIIYKYHQWAKKKVEDGKSVKEIESLGIWSEIIKLRFVPLEKLNEKIKEIEKKLSL